MDQLTFNFDLQGMDYQIMIREGFWNWSWKTFHTSIPRERLLTFDCNLAREIGVCPTHDSGIECSMASHCHVMLKMYEDDPDCVHGKLCTVCFHDAITKLGEASWKLEDVV